MICRGSTARPVVAERPTPRNARSRSSRPKSTTQPAFAHAASKVLSLDAISLLRRSDGEAVGAGGAGEEAVGDGGGAEAPGVQVVGGLPRPPAPRDRVPSSDVATGSRPGWA